MISLYCDITADGCQHIISWSLRQAVELRSFVMFRYVILMDCEMFGYILLLFTSYTCCKINYIIGIKLVLTIIEILGQVIYVYKKRHTPQVGTTCNTLNTFYMRKISSHLLNTRFCEQKKHCDRSWLSIIWNTALCSVFRSALNF